MRRNLLMTFSNNLSRSASIFILCWLAYGVSYFSRMNMAIAIPAMEVAGVASLGELGMAGSLFFWCYGFGHLINGALGDRFSPRLMIFFGLLLSSLSNLAITIFPYPIAIIFFWSLNGFCLSMLWGPMVRLLGYHISESKQSTVSLLMSVSVGGGSFVSWFILGNIIESMHNWRYAFMIPAIVCAVSSVMWLLFCGDSYEPHYLPVHSKEQKTSSEGFIHLFMRTRLYLIVIAVMMQGMIKDGLTLWLPTLMQNRFPEKSASSIVESLSLIPFISVSGLLIVAIFLKPRNMNYRRSTFLLFLAVALALILLFCLQLSFVFTFLMLGGISLFIALINSRLLSLLPMGFQKSNRVSTVAGLLDFAAYFAAGLFSIFSGILFQSGSDWNRIFLFLFLGVLLGAAVMIPAKKVIRE